ncbi:MAG: carbon-nitrogen hydrolase family protein, partial [Planctomycetes bacterium]|nr:carbon-nitrogen hydrolase family protein [Planctomycetota bacterium]
MKHFRIALLQLNGSGYDQDKNLERGLAACREAKAMGADLALFPEMWNTGYQYLAEADLQLQAELYENAIARDSTF